VQETQEEIQARPNQQWSIELVSDNITGGRHFRTLNFIDEYTRESLAIEVDLNIGGLGVSRLLDRLVNHLG